MQTSSKPRLASNVATASTLPEAHSARGGLSRSAAAGVLSLAQACSGQIGQAEPGLLSLQLQPSPAVQLTLLRYTVSHENGFVKTEPVAIGQGTAFSFRVASLPPETGYEITAYAEGVIGSAQTPTVCTGRATFEVKTAQTTGVSLRLQCEGASKAAARRQGPDQGNNDNKCPNVGVISASPAETPVGQDLQLRAELASDTDGPLPLTYRWSAASGSFSDPISTVTRYTCKQAGVVAVELAVSDGDSACDGAPAIVYLTCTDSRCRDLTHCPDSPAPASASAPNATTPGTTPAQASAAGGPSPRAADAMKDQAMMEPTEHGTATQHSQGGSGGAGGHRSQPGRVTTVASPVLGSAGHGGEPARTSPHAPIAGTESNAEHHSNAGGSAAAGAGGVGGASAGSAGVAGAAGTDSDEDVDEAMRHAERERARQRNANAGHGPLEAPMAGASGAAAGGGGHGSTEGAAGAAGSATMGNMTNASLGLR